MIKFQHSIFALPFALATLFVATQGQPSLKHFVLIVLCMITARNAAMSFNRIIDRHFDAKNPRTQNREIPSGALSLKFAQIFCVVNALLFILFSSFFNTLTFMLAPLALSLILGYSLTKRVTHFTQFFLGLSLGIAPLATWIAIKGELSVFPALVGLAVSFWVAGFDLIYSTLDYDYDKTQNLKNCVVKWGVAKALRIARFLHLIAIVGFVLAGIVMGSSSIYFLSILIMALLLIYEHSLIKPDRLHNVNMAFFTLNGWVSFIFLVGTLAEIYGG